jgi:murein DD-endopeptidase MepM/ murein hydrolase activator NlpD
VSRSLVSAVLLAIGLGIAATANAAEYDVVPPPLPPPSAEPIEVQGERWVDAWSERFHEPPGRYDAKALALAAGAGARPGEPREAYFERLAREIGIAYYAFAPVGAVHDDAVRYRLPFPLDSPRMLTQGVNGPITHQGRDAFTFDFAMPAGSPVLAARDGTVARVRDGFTEGGLDSKYSMRANDVLVLHADGTFAVYTHLSKGIPVREGQVVKQGDVLASSGNTGLTAGPHLHFGVYRRDLPASATSIPIRFGVGSPKGFVPAQNQFYGGKPKQTVGLVVTTGGGAALSEQNPLRLARNAKAALSVSMAAPGAVPEDVTRAAATRFFAPTGWSVVVDASGTVTASPTPDYAAAMAQMSADANPPGATNWGVVVVSYEDAAKGRFGFASVPVLIDDGPKSH